MALQLLQRIHHRRLDALRLHQVPMSLASLEYLGLVDRVAWLDAECVHWRDRCHSVEEQLNYKGPARRRYAHG